MKVIILYDDNGACNAILFNADEELYLHYFTHMARECGLWKSVEVYPAENTSFIFDKYGVWMRDIPISERYPFED